jgi:hypothetical protein
MYIPVLKGRMYENKFLSKHNDLLSEEIMPLIEIIQNKMGYTYCRDISDFVGYYDSIIGKPYFLDLFTFDPDMYKGHDRDQIIFAYQQRATRPEHYIEYLNNIVEITNSDYAIPVISFSSGRDFKVLSPVDFKKFFEKINSTTNRCAYRVHYKYLNEYIDEIEKYIRPNDFFMLDINESVIEPFIFDIETILELESECKKIVIHSPRPRDIKNGLYPDGNFTKLIDNSIRVEYKDYGFDGFGDYAGLKDTLPSKGSNGMGAALGMFYVNDNNQFFTIMNSNTELGARGHEYVINQAFRKHYSLLDPFKNCPAMNFINQKFIKRNKNGNFGQWKYITILRYVSQIKNSL